MVARWPRPLAVCAGVLVFLVAGCNNPISGAVSVTASDTTPFGNGQTVYVGFPNTDWYHTGVLKYASDGTGWIQQISNQVAVTDISVDSSGNMAVAANTALYRPSGGTWVTGSDTGVSQVALTSSSVVALTGGQLRVLTPATLATATGPFTVSGPTALFAPLANKIYVGTGSDLLSSDGTGSPAATGGSLSATVKGIYSDSSGTTVYVATSLGFSYSTSSGSGWSTNVTAGTIGVGTPQCVWVSGGTIYLGTSLGVAVSSDNGTTWSISNLQTSVTSISAATSNGVTCLYAATAQGLYVYSFSDKSWTLAFSGYPVNKVFVTVP